MSLGSTGSILTKTRVTWVGRDGGGGEEEEEEEEPAWRRRRGTRKSQPR